MGVIFEHRSADRAQTAARNSAAVGTATISGAVKSMYRTAPRMKETILRGGDKKIIFHTTVKR